MYDKSNHLTTNPAPIDTLRRKSGRNCATSNVYVTISNRLLSSSQTLSPSFTAVMCLNRRDRNDFLANANKAFVVGVTWIESNVFWIGANPCLSDECEDSENFRTELLVIHGGLPIVCRKWQKCCINNAISRIISVYSIVLKKKLRLWLMY